MKTRNRLLWPGMFLFLLGLPTGLAEENFTNVRMGLSAHLEGLMNGIFLLVLGVIWNEVGLPPSAKAAAYWTALYGTYMNWLTTHSLRFSVPQSTLQSQGRTLWANLAREPCQLWIPECQRFNDRHLGASSLGSSGKSIAVKRSR
jgi:hypothetical protein